MIFDRCFGRLESYVLVYLTLPNHGSWWLCDVTFDNPSLSIWRSGYIEAEWCIYAVVSSAIIGSDNGLPPNRCQAIIWTNAGIVLIGHRGTNFNKILIKIQQFKKKRKWLLICRLENGAILSRPQCIKKLIANNWNNSEFHWQRGTKFFTRNGIQFGLLIMFRLLFSAQTDQNNGRGVWIIQLIFHFDWEPDGI